MAKEGYIGINGVARRVSSGYVGVDGVARNIIAGYVGVNGVARQCYGDVSTPLDDDLVSALIDFTYKNNGDGTVTLLTWLGTLNGVESTEIVIPNYESIIL